MEAMMNSEGKHIKKRTRDISNAISHMCRGLVDLAKDILKNDTHYSPPYFKTAETVIEKANINHTKFPLQLQSNLSIADILYNGHLVIADIF